MNPVLLRKQLQDNASDLQDFCKDLKSWGEEMKRKEESLKNGDNEKASTNKQVKKITDKSYKKAKKDTTIKKPATKIGGTDYAAWDKFDVEAECERLDDDINDDSELTDECNDNMQDLALIEKEKGNKLVKNQKWDEAIVCYTKAINYFSYDPIFYANRALCYLKKNNLVEAENDCTLSIKIDNTYVKAYQRRAAAREGLNKLQHAECDLLRVLELEPNNKESKQSLENLRKKLGKNNNVSEQRPISKFTASRNKSNISTASAISTELASISAKTEVQSNETKKVFDTSQPISSWPEVEDIILVRPINKPPHLRSKKPLKRIDIIEKSDSIAESSVIESEPEAIKQHVFEKQQKIAVPNDSSVFKKEKIEMKNEDSITNVSAFKKRQSEKILEKFDLSNAYPKPNQNSSLIKSDDFKIIEKEPPDVAVSQSSIISKDIKNTSNKTILNERKRSEDDKINAIIVKPKTSVQFNLTWKNLKSPEDKYHFLKQVNSEDLPKIFLNSLESNVFSGILEILVTHFMKNKDPIYSFLNYLTQVKRFGTFTMFMSTTDKNNLWKLFDYIKEEEQKNKQDVDRLIEKYEL